MYFKLRTNGFKGAVCCKEWEEGCRYRAQGDGVLAWHGHNPECSPHETKNGGLNL